MNMKPSSLNSPNSQYSNGGYAPPQQNASSHQNNNILLISIKNLEKDLDMLKKLYDEELKLMRTEIEELSTIKNKYSLENFNLELKLKDFIVKYAFASFFSI